MDTHKICRPFTEWIAWFTAIVVFQKAYNPAILVSMAPPLLLPIVFLQLVQKVGQFCSKGTSTFQRSHPNDARARHFFQGIVDGS